MISKKIATPEFELTTSTSGIIDTTTGPSWAHKIDYILIEQRSLLIIKVLIGIFSKGGRDLIKIRFWNLEYKKYNKIFFSNERIK